MLDYTTREKKVLPVKLADGQELLLCPPKKALFDKLAAIEDRISKIDDPLSMYDEVAQLTADLLSTDKGGHKFTSDEVNEMFDLEDMVYLIFEYIKYTGQITKRPN